MKKVLCIECGLKVTNLIELEYDIKKPSNYKILKTIVITNPEGSVTKKGLYEIESLAFALKTVIAEQKIKTKDVIFTINSDAIHARTITLPMQKTTTETLDVLRAKVEEEKVFPIDITNNVLSYILLDKYKIDSDGNRISVEEDNKLKKDKKPSKSSIKKDIDKSSIKNVDDFDLVDIDEGEKEKSLDLKKPIKDDKKDKKDKSEEKKQKGLSLSLNKAPKDIYRQKLMGYIAPEDYIKAYLELGKVIGLNVISIDYVGNSVFNYIKQVSPEFKKGVYLIVQLTDFDCILTIFKDGMLEEQRSLDFSYSTFSAPLLARNKLFNNVVTNEEAYKYMTETNFFGLTTEDIDNMVDLTELDKEDYEKVKGEVEDLFLNLFNRITSFITQYRQSTGNNIDKIIYLNNMVEFPDIMDSIVVNTGVNAVQFNLTEKNCNLPKNGDILCILTRSNKLTRSYSEFNLDTLVGTLGSFIKPINFNILDTHFQRQTELTNKIILGIAFTSIVVCMSYTLLEVVAYTDALNKNQKLKNDILSATQAQQIYNTYMNSVESLESIATFDYNNITNLNEMTSILMAIESVVPKGSVVVDSINASNDSIVMSVRAVDKNSIAYFVQGLETLSWFQQYDEDGYETGGRVDIVSVTDSYTTDDTLERDVNTVITCYFKVRESFVIEELDLSEQNTGEEVSETEEIINED